MNGRPERVSERCIYKVLGLHTQSLEKLPKCREILNKYSETYEENWARRFVWAYNKLKTNNKPFYWSNIRKLTVVKRKNIDKVIPFIRKYANNENADKIIKLIGDGQKSNVL